MNAPTHPRMLPASWVDRLFDRMQGLYGSLWLDRWRTGEIENGMDRGLFNAKVTWATELGGFADQADRITQALDACRHRALPPTLPEFLDLCRHAQVAKAPALPAPKITLEQVQARAEQMGTFKASSDVRVDHKAWAREIVANPKAYPPISLKLACEALGASE